MLGVTVVEVPTAPLVTEASVEEAVIPDTVNTPMSATIQEVPTAPPTPIPESQILFGEDFLDLVIIFCIHKFINV